MAHFYGEICGQAKTAATKCGSKNSSLEYGRTGRNVGVRIDCFVDPKGIDRIEIWKTGGSNNPSTDGIIAVVQENRLFVRDENKPEDDASANIPAFLKRQFHP